MELNTQDHDQSGYRVVEAGVFRLGCLDVRGGGPGQRVQSRGQGGGDAREYNPVEFAGARVIVECVGGVDIP
jgi:hypothetical protein